MTSLGRCPLPSLVVVVRAVHVVRMLFGNGVAAEYADDYEDDTLEAASDQVETASDEDDQVVEDGALLSAAIIAGVSCVLLLLLYLLLKVSFVFSSRVA